MSKISTLIKPYFKATVFKTMWHTDQSVEKNSRNQTLHLCQLIFDKGTKTIHWRKDSLSNKWLGSTG